MRGDLRVTVRVEYTSDHGDTTVERAVVGSSGNPRHAAKEAAQLIGFLSAEVQSALGGVHGDVRLAWESGQVQ
jgi:hypothetical protein